MKGKTMSPGQKAWAEKLTNIFEAGIKNNQQVILANRQLFEEKVVKSGLEEALTAIREAIGMPIEGFQNVQDGILWLCGSEIPEEQQEERRIELERWIYIIQRDLRLTDNYQSAIRTYLFTGKIGSIQANASVEVNFKTHDVKVITHDHIRENERPYLREISEELLTKVGRTTKNFELTNHRARDPQKHALAIAMLRADKTNDGRKFSDVELVDEAIGEDPAPSEDWAKQERQRLNSIKNMRYDKIKRKTD